MGRCSGRGVHMRPDVLGCGTTGREGGAAAVVVPWVVSCGCNGGLGAAVGNTVDAVLVIPEGKIKKKKRYIE